MQRYPDGGREMLRSGLARARYRVHNRSAQPTRDETRRTLWGPRDLVPEAAAPGPGVRARAIVRSRCGADARRGASGVEGSPHVANWLQINDSLVINTAQVTHIEFEEDAAILWFAYCLEDQEHALIRSAARLTGADAAALRRYIQRRARHVATARP